MAPAGFQHEVLFYADDEDFLAGAVPYLQRALEAGESALVAVGSRNAEALRSELGAHAAEVTFADMRTLGRNPARMVPFWGEAAESQARSGGVLRGIAEPVRPSRTPAELDECIRNEGLLNLAFDGSPEGTLLCAYDAAALADRVLEEAARCHPLVHRLGAAEVNLEHRREAGQVAFGGFLDPPPRGAAKLRFDCEGLREVRALVASEARRRGLGRGQASDLVTAASELAANSIAHGGGRGVVWVWVDGADLVVEVSDAGVIEEPLVGRRKPAPAEDGGRGLWIANLLCDLVQIRSGPAGTSVRLRMAIGSAAPAGDGQSDSTGLLSFQ